MPGMGGLESAKNIRNSKSEFGNSGTPIVALTASVDTKIIESVYSSGLDGFLGKPVTKEQLQQMVEKFLRTGGK